MVQKLLNVAVKKPLKVPVSKLFMKEKNSSHGPFMSWEKLT
jgi:hypothetical protein